jgi:hypothetical protein
MGVMLQSGIQRIPTRSNILATSLTQHHSTGLLEVLCEGCGLQSLSITNLETLKPKISDVITKVIPVMPEYALWKLKYSSAFVFLNRGHM